MFTLFSWEKNSKKSFFKTLNTYLHLIIKLPHILTSEHHKILENFTNSLFAHRCRSIPLNSCVSILNQAFQRDI